MKATELKIGNLVNTLDGIFKVEMINPRDNSLGLYGRRYNLLTAEPIPLTEEWLLRFGLLRTVEFSFLLGCYEFVYSKGFDCWNVILKHGIITRIKYVHQLQNLYFALTGQELELKEGV